MERKPFENRVKVLLGENRAAWGAGLPDASALVAKLSVDTGIDFLWIDTEHRPFGVEAVEWIPLICRKAGCEPIIRVAGLEPDLIKKALDIGASGIMVPQVDTAEEARLAVQYCRYPPAGSRGVSPLWPIFADVPYEAYLRAANDETCVIVQVETPQGIANLEAICAVEGVDVVFAGPLDLSAALGHIGELDHPELQQFLADFPRRVAACGKAAGTSIRGLEASRRAYEQGYRFIVFGSLVSQGAIALGNDLKALRDHEK
jgi:4-hydroxy-2-oxoheptanedioate aldolase